jgi:ditrans,polycis-polyprenyl diphosphate synthase
MAAICSHDSGHTSASKRFKRVRMIIRSTLRGPLTLMATFSQIFKAVWLSIVYLLVGKNTAEDLKLSFFEEKVIIPLLRICSIPNHISFIMDGNRRFARNRNEPTLVGHRMGYDRLRRVLLWCFELGVKEVSVYAFSVDNFSRTQEEVDYLMDLVETKLEELCDEKGFVMTHKIRVRICGDKTLLRPSLRAVTDRVESATADHTTGIFNILLAYSSKRELLHSIEQALRTVNPKDITWDSISENMYSSTPVDLVIRTSGETRLSDFLVWQIQPEETVVVFVKNLWPDYSLSDLAVSVLKYHSRICNLVS